MTITANDSGSGVKKIQLYQKRYNESTYQMIKEWNTTPTKSYTGSVTVSTNGISSFYCIVWDAAGNTNRRVFGTNSDIASITTTVIYVDKVGPKVTAPELSNSSVGQTGAYVSLYASDDAIE
jgi:superfamily I DNA and RNA helicase